MAKNYYTLTLDFVSNNGEPDYKIDVAMITVKQGNNLVTNLVKDDFILISGGATIPSTDWILDNGMADMGMYGIDFVKGKELANDTYLLIQIVNHLNPSQVSDHLYINFSASFNSQGQATIKYTINGNGQYYFVLNQAAGQELNVKSQLYTFNKAPVAGNCSIEAGFSKPYLSQTIIDSSGLEVPLNITLKDSTNNPIIGNNEVAVYAELQ